MSAATRARTIIVLITIWTVSSGTARAQAAADAFDLTEPGPLQPTILQPLLGELWAVTRPNAGGTVGLWSRQPGEPWYLMKEAPSGLCRARLLLPGGTRAVVGPWLLEKKGTDSTTSTRIEGLGDRSLAAAARHLTRPEEAAWLLATDGTFFEVDLATARAKVLMDLREELALPDKVVPAFRDALTARGMLWVAHDAPRGRNERIEMQNGRLSGWTPDRGWTTFRRQPVAALWQATPRDGEDPRQLPLYAIGRDERSATLTTLVGDTWSVQRLPHRQAVGAEGGPDMTPRMRMLSDGSLLTEAYGVWWSLPPRLAPGKALVPRLLGGAVHRQADFCAVGPDLMLATGTATRVPRAAIAREPVRGSATLWANRLVNEGETSEATTLLGRGRKTLHLQAERATVIEIEIDAFGDGRFASYGSIDVPDSRYAFHVFPAGFSAPRVRLRTTEPVRLSARIQHE